MKTLIFATLISVLSFSAVARSSTDVKAVCLKPDVIDQITRQTGEDIVWIGTVQRDDELGTAALYMHPKTGSWSYVEHWQGYSCVIGGGDYSKHRLPNKPEKRS